MPKHLQSNTFIHQTLIIKYWDVIKIEKKTFYMYIEVLTLQNVLMSPGTLSKGKH